MRVKCLLFGEAKELYSRVSGCPADSLELPEIPEGIDSNQLFEVVKAQFPPSAQAMLDHSMLAVNLEYVTPEAPVVIQPSAEIALIPPVSGG